MRNLLMVAILGLSLSASAQSRRISASDYRGSSSGMHAVSGAFGFYSSGSSLLIDTSKTPSSASPDVSGFFGIGGDYEYLYAKDLTIGGIFRYYSTSDSVSSAAEHRVAGWHLAGMVKCYLETDNFKPYIGAGFGLLNMSWKSTSGGTSTEIEPSTGLGFNMALGVLYKFSDTMQFGVENLRVWALGEKMQGMPINDFMFKGRFVL